MWCHLDLEVLALLPGSSDACQSLDNISASTPRPPSQKIAGPGTMEPEEDRNSCAAHSSEIQQWLGNIWYRSPLNLFANR